MNEWMLEQKNERTKEQNKLSTNVEHIAFAKVRRYSPVSRFIHREWVTVRQYQLLQSELSGWIATSDIKKRGVCVVNKACHIPTTS